MNIHCLLSSVLFCVGTIFNIAHTIFAYDGGLTNELKELDPTYIKNDWERKRLSHVYEFLSSWCIVFAWIFLTIPILQLCWILSNKGSRRIALHTTVSIMVLCACMTELLALLFQIGMSNITKFITVKMNLSNWITTTTSGNYEDNIGWRSMEIIYMLTRGMTLWVEAFEYLALFIVLLYLYKSMISLQKDYVDLYNTPSTFTFGAWMAHLGLLIGLLSFADFTSQILRKVGSWQLFNDIGQLLGICNRLLLLPIYLCCLGKQLYVATTTVEFNTRNSESVVV